MSNWSRWVNVETAKSKTGPFNHLGIYRIRAATRQGKPISINRLCGIDSLGILYIGRSGVSPHRTIANRIGEFAKQHHSGGITYARANVVLRRTSKFSRHALQVSSKLLVEMDIRVAEAKTLQKYFSKFGELPPCNSVKSNAKVDG